LPLWKPKNYEDNFLGPVTMRMGLEKSRNTITVRVGQFAGWQKVADTIKRFGINDNPKVVPSMVLGALETTLSRMTIAYSIIANNGRQVEPHYIELIKDRKGNVIYKRDYTECPECKAYMLDNEGKILPPDITVPPGRAITDEASSYQITSLMMGGIQRGTGRGAKNVDQIIACKTGTTNKAKDAWFMGFTPKIVVGTYVGHDIPKSMGKRVSGASIALPIFVHFMQNGYKDEPSVDFIVPDSIALSMVDYITGKPSTEKDAILEAFKVNNYNPALNVVPNEVTRSQQEHDPFANIQKQDTSQELY
jgi:penicillin-binding protein 1A